jgi:hypothetical protein
MCCIVYHILYISYIVSIYIFFVCFFSALSIVPVKEEHNGQWNCLLVSVNGNKSKAVSVIVISEHTRYCPLAGKLSVSSDREIVSSMM